MRKTLTALLLLGTLAAGAQTINTPVDYLDYIGKEQENIAKSTWKYMEAAAHSKRARKINNTREALIKTIQAASKKIQGLKDGYKGDVEYRDQMLAYLSMSEQMIREDYAKIVDMQEIAEQSYDMMEAYILLQEKVNEKFGSEVDKINAGQAAFAKKYNVQIGDGMSEIGQKIKLSNEVFDNKTELYLILFKANFTEMSLVHAVEAKDVATIQQNANALTQFSTEGLDKLKTFKPYKNDPMLVNATKKYLEFAKSEASEFAPKTSSFLLLSQKFEDAKKAMDAKKASERTKEDVDTFNKLVDEFNKGVNDYNRLNAKYNNDRNANLQNWEATADNFVAKHVPQD